MADRKTLTDWLAQIQVRLFTWRAGQLVGVDGAGNRYFRSRKTKAGNRERRWVLYNGETEASRVPPEWHGWLHHAMDNPIPQGSRFHKPWVQPHEPNHTGTSLAYRPPGHQLEGGKRDKATGDYEAWSPDNSKAS